MKNEKQNSKQTDGNVVVAEAPKPATQTAAPAEPKIKKTPTNERQYQLVAVPSIPPKGKQRQIVIAALQQDPDRGYSVKEVTEIATKAGLTAVAGVQASCAWHLHHLNLLGIAKVLNPTMTVDAPAATVETAK